MNKKTHFGYHLHPNEPKKNIILGFINIHTLPESHKGETYFDLTKLMLEKGFGHIGLVEIGRHWPLMPYEDKTPQRFRGNFMSQQLDYTTSYNQHDTLSGSYQYGGTLSLPAGNLIVRTIKGWRYFSGLYRWSWQRFKKSRSITMDCNSLQSSTPHYRSMSRISICWTFNPLPTYTTSKYFNAL